MARLSFLVLAGAALLAAPALLPVSAHCPGEVPRITLTHPSDGVAVQEACYSGFSTCLVDTFYKEKLRQELIDRFRASRYAVFAYVDSVNNYETYDSVIYQGQLYYVDTFTTERVHISIHTFLKDTLPVRKLTFVDRWMAFKGDPFSTTHIPLMDTPFVAFFNAYDTLESLGIGPMDGCFFEPTAFIVKAGRIHKKGVGGFRMPGVSVATDEFFAAVGIAPVPVPPVGIRRLLPRYPRSPRLAGQRRFDLLGRPLMGGRPPITVFSVWDSRPGRHLDDAVPADGISRP